MSNDLKAASDKLNSVMVNLIEETKRELADVNARIAQLNNQLQEKEMQTDRSENASFQIAKDERDVQVTIRNLLQNRIESLESESDNYIATGFITLGTTVDLRIITIAGKAPVINPTTFIVKLVNHDLSKANVGLIAVDSKVGSAIMGHAAGETVEVVTPKGVVSYKIERIY